MRYTISTILISLVIIQIRCNEIESEYPFFNNDENDENDEPVSYKRGVNYCFWHSEWNIEICCND